ncbi:sodium/glutamate symporter [bacterium]|nr:MAG: sodium/glutamate symporter [bacterium]
MQLDSRQTIILAILVLFLGKFLNRRIGFLRQYNVPEPVTGGIVGSVGFGILYLLFDIDVEFSNHYRDIFLVVFFTAIGLKTEARSIIKGGRVLFLFASLAVLFLFLQNVLGVLIARMFGENPNIGILAGSAALQGGHGNIVAWAPILAKDYGVTGGMEIGMTMATFGLILGGILGGPVAKYLIQKHDLKTSDEDGLTIGKKHGAGLVIDYDSALKALLMVSVSIGMGIQLNMLVAHFGLALPLFVPCMLSGVVLANLVPVVLPNMSCPTNSPTLSIVSELSLGLFLAMAMVALKFWEIGDQALFILANLSAQVVLILLFSTQVLFRVLGRNYDSAVITAGYLGSALGATPTAMANMAAVTQRFGASQVAFIVIPIVAAFIAQASNAFIIQAVLDLIN